jgi:hypothetical protein
VWNWDILLHGNPSADTFPALKLAAGGELGIGVGEEEWGSGEREVLEGFITRTEGLVDLVVSRFGDEPLKDDTSKDPGEKSKTQGPFDDAQSWLGMDACPRPGDGVIFSGIGAISRGSLRDISKWMEWIYKYGEDAYGVRENPSSTQRRKRRKAKVETTVGRTDTPRSGCRTSKQNRSRSRDRSPGIPPPIVSAAEQSLQRATQAASSRSSSMTRTPVKSDDEENAESSMFGTDAMMKYLTLGYGTSWSLGLSPRPTHRRVSALKQQSQTPVSSDTEEAEPKEMQTVDPTPEISETEDDKVIQKPEYTIGRYIIGLRGDLENDAINEEDENQPEGDPGGEVFSNSNNRTMLRTLVVEMSKLQVRDKEQENKGICFRNAFPVYSLLTI